MAEQEIDLTWLEDLERPYQAAPSVQPTADQGPTPPAGDVEDDADEDRSAITGFAAYIAYVGFAIAFIFSLLLYFAPAETADFVAQPGRLVEISIELLRATARALNLEI